MVLGPIDGAAAGFALQLAVDRWRGWLKRRRLSAAYRTAAAETIEHCLNEGYPAGSDVWHDVTTLLGNETKARQIASWYASRTIDSTAFRDLIGEDATVGKYLKYFVTVLNRQRANLLPLDLHELAEIITTQTGRRSGAWVKALPKRSSRRLGALQAFLLYIFGSVVRRQSEMVSLGAMPT